MGKRILGFDIGTNSAGWAFIEEGESVIDCGVRIFEMGNRMDKDNEISRKGDRTTARSIRKRLHRFKLRRQRLKALLEQNDMLPELPKHEEKGTDKTDPFKLFELRYKALDEQIELKELGKVLLYFNKKRGFKSSRKDELAEDKETGTVKKAISGLKQQIEETNCRTVGEYYYHLKKAHRQGERLTERIKDNWIGRDMYEYEFDLIWEKQQEYYPEILTPELKKEIKDRTIFYQRRLKSQKHLVSNCRFEPKKKVAPKSSVLFQEFRIWQQLNNLKVTYEDRVNSPLTFEEKQQLADVLREQKTLTHAGIKKVLGFPKRETTFNDIDELKGISTYAGFVKVFGEDYHNFDEKKKHQLWHTLFFFDDNKKLIEYAQNTFGFDPETAKAYAGIKLEPDYGNVSHKAIKKMLPYLKEGHDYAKAAELAGYHHSYSEEEDSKDRILQELVPQLDDADIRNPVVQKSVNECISIANDIIETYGKPDVVKIELSRELKKPRHIRERQRRENRQREQQRKIHADFLNSTGLFSGEVSWKSTLINKYQLWLELGCENEEAEEFRRFAGNIKKSDLEKYRLWLESDRISPYTGNVIPLSRLFDPDIEIEHIVPYSKSLDNSFMNKTLSEGKANKDKGNRLPYEYFKEQPPEEWEAYKQRVKKFPPPKRDKLLAQTLPDDFLNSQLTNTGYIGKLLLKQMKKGIRTVEVRNGQATAALRRSWGLNSVLHPAKEERTPEQEEKFNLLKNRKDHRHHAIDAIVVACTTNRHIQLLSSHHHMNRGGKMVSSELDPPWRYFRGEVASMMDKLFVSHKGNKRLVSKSINKYRHSKAHKKKGKAGWQETTAARGPLHEETFYGQITRPDTGEQVYVSKKDVAEITAKQLDKVIDPEIRETIRERLERKEKIDHEKNPLIITQYFNGERKPVRVRHARMQARAKNMVQLRPNENNDLFVPTGSNYCIAIYEGNNNGKTVRGYVNVTFLEAVKRSMNGQKLFPPSIHDDKTGVEMPLVMVLKAKDMLVTYDNSEDEINWQDPYELFERLYYVIKWSGKDGMITLHKHFIAEENPDKTATPIVLRKVPNSLKAVKVKINRLGKIERL